MNADEQQAPFIDRGEPLPRSYAENIVVAMVRDPEHIFAYWDISPEVRVSGTGLVLRVCCLSEGRFDDIDCGREAESWHLAVSSNRTYRFQLYERRDSGEMRLLSTSQEVTTPVSLPGATGAEKPAEVIHAERHPLARQRRQRLKPPRHVAGPGEGPVRARPEKGPRPVAASSGGLS